MKTLSIENKNLFFGGAKVAVVKKIKPVKTYTKKKYSATQKADYIKKVNYGLHNASMVTFSLTSAALNIYESIEKLYPKTQKKNNSNRGGYGGNFFGNKKSHYSEVLKPSVRFSPYPHKTTLSFGIPWFY